MFARVIIDISNANVDRMFTYFVPDDIEVRPGHRVLVPFSRNDRHIEGFVIELCDEAGTSREIKSIIKTMEPYTALLNDQLALANWISKAYHCTKASALRIMLPAKLRGSRIKEKLVRTVKIAEGIDANAELRRMLNMSGIPKAPKQYEVLEMLARSNVEIAVSEINEFIPGASPAVSALLRKGLLVEHGRVTYRDPFSGSIAKGSEPPLLTPAQLNAVDCIESAPAGECILLHGVTGSGKTEVYMRVIANALNAGMGSILLVPEISLTPQTTDRFRHRFGDNIAILHSHLSDGERYDEWRRIRFGHARIVIGARSAIFAPVERLGMIIIDEAHEPSYQSEITPKYSAIETAIRRARITGAKLVLGSATPSLTDYYRAKHGRYTLVEMPQRINGVPMPRVDIVDMRQEFIKGNNSIFSGLLLDALKKCLANREQAILFLNRRGYSSHVECRSCGFVFTCPNCDVALTYHKYDNSIRCHYCGAAYNMPKVCPSCGMPYIKYTGIGTQQVEEQLKKELPEARCIRMDTDTTAGKNSHKAILDAFSQRKADVLIGTQMVAKGLDIPNVTLVGVVFADSTLFHSDYRSSERTFQLLTQVAGRAGRAEKNGYVVVQTNAPEHRAIKLCTSHDYKTFYNLEINDRMRTLFPPFAIFIRAMFVGSDEASAAQACDDYAQAITGILLNTLKKHNAQKELLFVMPGAAPIRRRDNEFRYAVIIKLVRTSHTLDALNAVYAYSDSLNKEYYRGIEVNPQDML